MKIAFISFEYPPDTAFGGIATYVRHAVRMLAGRGHDVEVFAGSGTREGRTLEAGVAVHRIRAADAWEFGARVADVAVARHAEVRFDVFESPELAAEAAAIVRRIPDAALVVKLHTPSYLIGRFTAPPLNPGARFRFAIGALRRGRWPKLPDNTTAAGRHALERNFALLADEIAAPSAAIRDLLAREWGLPADRTSSFPLPYEPDPALLRVPPGATSRRVLFVGRLEPRKGVQFLGRAIPAIAAGAPEARFQFVGRVLHSPRRGVPMDEYVKSVAGTAASDRLEFTGAVPSARLPEYYSQAAVAVFPSVWESFGYVCLEAMAAARAVVGSREGGMREILDDGQVGVLVSPTSPAEIARAVGGLLRDPARCADMGARARARVLSVYGYAAIAALQEASYGRAIARRRALGPRRDEDLRSIGAPEAAAKGNPE